MRSSISGRGSMACGARPEKSATASQTFWAANALFCLAILAGSPASALDHAKIMDLFSESKALSRQANELVNKDPQAARELYARAAMRLERIASEGGIRNGRLYYNIGNAYFRMNDLGRAILYYRRAQRYDPNDPNLRQNLGFARSRRRDRIEEPAEERVMKILLFWHYDFSPRARSFAFAACFLAFWAGALLKLFKPARLPRWPLVILAVVAGLALGSVLAEGLAGSNRRYAVVLAPEIVARKGDGETFQPSFAEPLHAGSELRIIEDRGQWLQVELRDGRTCWIPAQAAGEI